jgi:hypothetical protein
VHYLSWSFPPSPAIDKIEVQRDDVTIAQTSENELYDSDFKSGHEVTYKFYYLFKDGKRLLVGEHKVNALSMANLFSAIKIEPGIGMIKWDFNELRNFKYLKYIELYSKDQCLYKQGGHLPFLFFEDKGKLETQENVHLGLPDDQPQNFQLAIFGVAPITRKCKKKWVLSIKGIQCEYPDLPAAFSVISEHCCVYFDWDSSPTQFLKEIILTRSQDGFVLYQGPNLACSICDDNEKHGLELNRKYAYILELVYSSYRTSRIIEVEVGKEFDPRRLELASNATDESLCLHWNPEVKTSIDRVGCRVSKSRLGNSALIARFLKRITWANFSEGELRVQIPAATVVYYQVFYQDSYGHVFGNAMQVIEEVVEDGEEELP